MTRHPKALFVSFLLILLFSGCASLEERLCNSTTSFQKGYDDVLNGRQGSPGLSEGEACKKSNNYSYSDYHRDYTAGFNKAKLNFCTQSSAINLGKNDAANGKGLRESLSKLSICIADESIKVNLESFYEIGYRKEFCQAEKVQALAIKDAENLSGIKKAEEYFQLCAYQKALLYKTYQSTYLAEIKKQCSPSRAGSLGVHHARDKKSLSAGLELLEKCPNETLSSATQSYTLAYQTERSNMMEEERLKLEQERMAQEETNRQELLRLKRRQIELEEQRLKQSHP